MVSRAAEANIKEKLGKSPFNKPEFVAAMLDGVRPLGVSPEPKAAELF